MTPNELRQILADALDGHAFTVVFPRLTPCPTASAFPHSKLKKEDLALDKEASMNAVKVLLDAAGVTVSDEEFEQLVWSYPTLRAEADAIYRPELRDEAPALAYDPLVGF